jgi:hypothetical protein
MKYAIKTIPVVLLLLTSLLLIGCGDLGDDPGVVTPPVTVDTVRWNDVSPILSSNCVVCHSADNAGSYFNAASYTSVLNHQTNGGNDLVVAGEADNSEMVWRLEGTNGVSQMPAGSAPLSESNITLVKDWINDGALE